MKIVLLPGLDGTGKLFELFIPVLPEGIVPVVGVYPQNENMGYSQLLEYAWDVCPEDEPYILLGESFSGPIAIQIAAGKPRMLRGLILVNSFATCPKPFIVNLICRLPDRVFESPSSVVLNYLLRQREPGVEPATAIMRVIRSRDAGLVRSRLEILKAVDVRQMASEIVVPVCVMQSVNDIAVPSSARRILLESLREPHVHELPGNHFALQTHPKRASRIVSEFTQQSDRAAG